MRTTGTMIYYYKVCKRKLWYHCNEISMENEDVKYGKVIEEEFYNKNRKHININDEINIDFIEDSTVINEVKKSKAIELATIYQVKYYLFYLKKLGVDNITAKIDYPLLKKTKDVVLDEKDIEEIKNMLEEIHFIVRKEHPDGERASKKVCRKCAYFDLCNI